MPIATKKTTFELIPAGVQQAVCVGVIDIGTQPTTGNFAARRKVFITWELPSERIMVKSGDGTGEIEMPRVISKEYTLSTDKKSNLRHDLEAWRGKAFTAEEVDRFDVGKLIGANCQLNIIHKPSADGSKTYANVGGIMPLAKGAAKLTPENDTIVYDIPDTGTITFPANLPEWIQAKIRVSDEFVERTNPTPAKAGVAATPDQAANLTAGDEAVPF